MNLQSTYPKSLLCTRDNALGESTYQVVIGVRHKLLGSHINSRRWVPSDQDYGAKGPTDMEKSLHYDNPTKGRL